MVKKKQLQVKDKMEIATKDGQVDAGLVFTPQVDIFENDQEIQLIVDMPGVAADDVAISLHDGILTLSGNVRPWEEPDESDVMVEFEIGKYFRRFNLPKVVDQDKIDARLENGVLILILPKVEKALPRKITVTTG